MIADEKLMEVKTMSNDMSKNNKKISNIDPKTRNLFMGIAAVLVVILLSVIMFIESAEGKIIIKNNTDYKLEYVEMYFVDAEGPVHNSLVVENIEADESSTVALGSVDLLGREANFEVKFKYEGYDEIFTDAGYFNDTFEGTIDINFTQENAEKVRMNIKASNGLIPSQLIQCNEVYDVYLKEGFIAD